MKQAEYKGEIYSIEAVYVYDEYISIYKGNLLETEAIKVPLSEVKILPMHHVMICRNCKSEKTYKCKVTDVIVCKDCGYQD